MAGGAPSVGRGARASNLALASFAAFGWSAAVVWATQGMASLAYATGAASTAEGELTRRLVALGSTGLVLAGYVPPRFARQRWGATPAFDG